MKNENVSYWESLHKKYSGQLRSVGHPELSEQFNELKYKSETETFLDFLADVRPEYENHNSLSIMDIGAGAGYWTGLMHEWLDGRGFETNMTTLDISEHALKVIKERYPWVQVIKSDLGTIDTGILADAFDLIISCYCFHHLLKISEFLNALRFASRSLRKGGFLVIIDPILSRPFNHTGTLDYASQRVNGIPRPLHILDDVFFEEGLQRWTIRPAVSFILNGNIEGNSRIGFALCHAIWCILQNVYRSGALTRAISNAVLKVDSGLKTINQAYSSSLCVYRKLEPPPL